MQKQRVMSTIVPGYSGPGSGTKVSPVLEFKDAVPRPGDVGKRPRIQRGPTPSSDVKQSLRISAQRIELIVIADTEPESSGTTRARPKTSSVGIAYKTRMLLAETASWRIRRV